MAKAVEPIGLKIITVAPVLLREFPTAKQ